MNYGYEFNKKLVIPWDTKVQVKDFNYYTTGHAGPGIYSVTLSLGDNEIGISRDGSLDISVDSKKIIGAYMKKSKELTRSLRRYLSKYRDFFIDGTTDWLRGGPEEEVELPPWGNKKPTVFDWWPDYTPPKKPKIGKLAEYRSGRAGDISDDWVGSSFPYVHFRMPDGDDGLAIDWGERHEEASNLTRLGEPAGQEVWLGDVEGFISANLEFLDDWETYASYNGAYDGTLLWALNEMGSLVQGRAPDWVLKSVKSDPSILWPELVQKILGDPKKYPEELELAAEKLWNEERRRLEKEQGQIYLWPGENDDG